MRGVSIYYMRMEMSILFAKRGMGLYGKLTNCNSYTYFILDVDILYVFCTLKLSVVGFHASGRESIRKHLPHSRLTKLKVRTYTRRLQC